jgi:hypothetical protein
MQFMKYYNILLVLVLQHLDCKIRHSEEWYSWR